MREILFRGKCLEAGIYYGRWLEGFYGEDDGRSLISHSTDIGLIGYACDSDTIGQYTGLNDRKGNKIFEGDICHFYGGEYYSGCWETNHVCEIKINHECLWYIENAEHVEVIGNIYDNPELLEGGNNNGKAS